MSDSNASALDEVLAGYLASLDAGKPGDREALIASHPDLADDLRAFFANQDRIEDLAAPLRPEPSEQETIAVSPVSTPDMEMTVVGSRTEDGPGVGDQLHYFGDYELLDEIGRGGMGVVFKARQVSLNRLVALKIIRSAELASEEELRRFQNEAEAVAQLDHPNIVPIIEIGECGNRKYFSMKLIVGHGLDATKANYATDPRAAAREVAIVARAVHHAHLRGILHRDLKPSNILIDEQGRPHVTDFGLAKRVEADAEVTRSGAIMGTPAYMAPEQASGKRGAVTTSSDVYGLGSVLYDLLAGHPPFQAPSILDTLVLVMEKEAPPLRPLNPKVDRDLETVCLKCLEKDPKRRYVSAEALAEDLDRWLAGEPIAARHATSIERGWKWARRHPAISTLVTLLAVTMLGGLIGITTLYFQAEAARRMALERALAEEKMRVLADKSAAAALKAQAEATEARAKSEASLYANRIKLAQQYWYDGQVAQADRLLDACPDDSRAWEWRYLKRLGRPELFSLPGNGAYTTALAFSDDGRRMAAFSDEAIPGVVVWDMATRKRLVLVNKLLSDPPLYSAAGMTRDGSTLALGDDQGRVTLFDATTGKPIRDVGKLDGGVASLGFNPDGSLLAVASIDSRERGVTLLTAFGPLREAKLEVWKVADGSVVFAPANVGNVAAFSPDGRYLLSTARGTYSRLVPEWPFSGAIWRVGDWTKVRDLGPIDTWSFSSDGSRFACSGQLPRTYEDYLKVVEVESGREILSTRPVHSIRDLALSPDGLTLATARFLRNEFDLWDLETRSIVRTYRGHKGKVEAVTFTPDGSRIVSSGRDKTIRFWDPKLDPVARRPTNVRPVSFTTDVVIRPDTGQVAFVQGDALVGPFNAGHAITLFDPWSGRVMRSISRAHLSGARRLAYSADGKVLASGGQDAKVSAWDPSTGDRIGIFAGHDGWIEAVAVSPDGRWVASSSEPKEVSEARSGDKPMGLEVRVSWGAVKIWEAKTGKLARSIPLAQTGNHLAFSPDGKSIAASDWTGVGLFDPATGRRRWEAKVGPTDGLAFSPDGSTIAADGSEGIFLFDARTGRERAKLVGLEVGLRGGLAFSPDGRRIATARGAEIKLWDTADGQEILSLARLPGPARAQPSAIADIAFSPDGRRLIAALVDGGIEVWE